MRNGGINRIDVLAEAVDNPPQRRRLKEGHRRAHDAKEECPVERSTAVDGALGHSDGAEKDENG